MSTKTCPWRNWTTTSRRSCPAPTASASSPTGAPTEINQVWLKRRVTDGAPVAAAPHVFRRDARDRRTPPHRQPVRRVTAPSSWACPAPGTSACRTSAWSSRRAAGEELQTEYFVPRADAVAALRAVARLTRPDRPAAADLRGAHHRRRRPVDESVLPAGLRRHPLYLAQDWAAVSALAAEHRSRPGAVRAAPALGQAVHHARAQVQARFARLPDFQRLLQSYDPDGKFRNASWTSISSARLSSRSHQHCHSERSEESPSVA